MNSNNLNILMSKSREDVKRYIKKDIYYDYSVEAFVVRDNRIASHILKNKHFTAHRKADYIHNLGIREDKKEFLIEFYENWLMYMKENQDHLHIKRQVQRAMNQSIGHIVKRSKEATNILTNINKHTIDIIEEVSIPFTTTFLAKFYGITKENYLYLLETGKPVIQFIFHDNTNVNIDSVIQSIKTLRAHIKNIVNNESYEKEGFLNHIIKETGVNKNSIDAILNMIIDGHAPFLSSMNSLIFNYLTCNHMNIDTKSFVLESLRKKPPFPYIRRICINNTEIKGHTIKTGDHILLLVFLANEDQAHSSLTFGHGIHYCLGVMIITLALESFLNMFMKHFKQYQLDEYHWHTTFGFQALTELTIKKAD